MALLAFLGYLHGALPFPEDQLLHGENRPTLADESAAGARLAFPRGLFQPPGAYRFGLDALLLASFAARLAGKASRRVIELGSGCGAALLAFSLSRPGAVCLGLEREMELVEAAARNNLALGLSSRTAFRLADLSEEPFWPPFEAWKGRADLVLANPPWRRPEEGRLPATALRGRALFAAPDVVKAFHRRALEALRPGGLYCLIVPDMANARESLSASGLFVKSILPVASFADREPQRYLLCASPEAGERAPHMEMPLVIHERVAGGPAPFSSGAREFCPWLKNGGTRRDKCHS